LLVATDASGVAGVSVLLGNGNGTFQDAITYEANGYYAFSLAVGDINRDGKPDLVVASLCADSPCYTDGELSVLLGNGDGTFQNAVAYDTGGYYASSVAITDVNGDGTLDLVVANSNSIEVLLGNGDGTFQALKTYASGGSSIAIEDVNRDGKADLLVTTDATGSAGVSVLLGNGNGTFQAPLSYSSGDGVSPIPSVIVGDVNGDGKRDLVVVNECDSFKGCDTGIVDVLLGNGDGTFQTKVSYSSGGIYAESAALADVNGDGKLDLVVANVCADSTCAGGPTVGLLLGNGDGTFQAAVTYNSGGSGASFLVVADVNGDGKLDLLVPGGDGMDLDVLLGNGDGTFQAAQGSGPGGSEPSSVWVADFNSDGKLDAVVANSCTSSGTCQNGTVDVLRGNGDGTFHATVTYGSGGFGVDYVVAADMNGDGKTDLVVSNECVSSSNCENGSVSVLLGNGDGTFQPAVSMPTPGQTPGVLAVADFNGDGKLDVASGSGDVLLLGNGDGTFEVPESLGVVGFGIAVGDFNRDGRPDLAVASNLDRVMILQNALNFHTSTTTGLTSSPNSSGYQQPVTFVATITSQSAGQASGTITFKDGSTTLGSFAVSDNSASFVTSSLMIGAHSIRAIYSGDANFTGSTSTPLTQIVTKAITTTALVSSVNPSTYGRPVSFTALVSSSVGLPTGKVEILNGTTVLATLTLASGSAKYTTSKLFPGSNTVTAVYLGDSKNNGSSSSPVNQFVLDVTTTTLTSLPNPAVYGQTVIFTATVNSSIGTPPDGEQVIFKQGATALGTGTLSGGEATLSVSTLAVGTKPIIGVYGGDSNLTGSMSKVLRQVVNKATSTTTLLSSVNPSAAGQSVAFTATVIPQVSGLVTGRVTFYDGATQLKSVPLVAGTATFTTTKLSAGTHNVMAIYGGSADFTRSSDSVTETVN